MNRKRLLLAVLIGLLVLSLVYAFWATPRQEKAPARAESTRSAAKKPAAGKTAPPTTDRLHLGLLAQEPQPFSGASRDIFRFSGTGAPAVEAPAESAPPEEEKEAPPPPPPSPPPTPEEILRERVAGLTTLGLLDKGGVRTVFLSYEGELSLVKAGEIFGKRHDLVAKEITANDLVVGAVDGPETVRIKLVDKDAPSMMTPGAASPGARAGGVRPGGVSVPPRRGILQQRRAPPPEPVEEEMVEPEIQEPEVQEPEGQAPEENVIQEEPPNELPNGEGNGNK